MKLSIAFVLGVCGLGMAADLGSGLQKVKCKTNAVCRSICSSTSYPRCCSNPQDKSSNYCYCYASANVIDKSCAKD
ncbi:hypothetical protein BGZ61DRAFT_449333 [Ilyonectria robusta]|uniref:uncharacterized protein n=1 Tax=Ilyonectria robusta TaxID=1079257 RepID=UPI001E8E98FB|nr:uncharacterized protein BGZ61DRAFT_449333 [Ilyonectria robusta]KAH6977434.1 hypothetical protein BKA56DRAFT_588287 [Ilyonectria sp. MPI-CAGE-AT-0026]KAH8714633.1 hypothetical protein BGZ61DRAFT_449333 [Ilyonectria robusta]